MLLLRRRSPLDIERKLALSLSAPSLLILQAEFVLGIAGCLIGIASGRRNCLSGLIGRILRFHPARHSSRSNMMLHSILSRLALSAVLAAAMLPAVVSAQSQDSQSVAEASRRARAQKKNAEKPSKVITDDTLVVKKGMCRTLPRSNSKCRVRRKRRRNRPPLARQTRRVAPPRTCKAPRMLQKKRSRARL